MRQIKTKNDITVYLKSVKRNERGGGRKVTYTLFVSKRKEEVQHNILRITLFSDRHRVCYVIS